MHHIIKSVPNSFMLMGNAHHHDIHQNKINELNSQNVKIQNQVSNWKMIALIAVVGMGIAIILFYSSKKNVKEE
jgi:hypothetical protein